MRVFVLSTGRCGSTTFAKACAHFDNFTSGHESRAERIGDARFDYADDHIESDNRLSWMLGQLGTRFDSESTYYVHLTREPLEVASSLVDRWETRFLANIVRAFANGIVMRPTPWPVGQREEVSSFYVDTVNANIAHFLKTQRHVMTIAMSTVREDFAEFVRWIGATGDLDAALREWDVRHNARRVPPKANVE